MSPPRPRKSSDRSASASKRGPRQAPIARPEFLSDGDKGTRLQKYLAAVGVESRRNCEELIRAGRITVDGEIVSNPAVSVRPDQQDVRFDGERLRPQRYRYYLLNKPKGVVCTTRDPAGRPLAVNCVPNDDQRMFTVGRLDENTMGLLLVTNDGPLAEHLAHPRYEVVRRYRVQVAGIPDGPTLAELKKGMHFSDGYFRFQSIRVLKRKGRSTFLELELQEGKNREIRRLLARAGHKVIQLERVAFGPLRIGRLEVGECRELRAAEIRELYAFVQKTPAARRKAAGGTRPPRKASDSTDRKSDDRKSTDRKSDDRKSDDRKSDDRKPADRKPADRKPADRKPADRKPADRKSTDRKSTDRKSTDRKSDDRKSGERKPVAKKPPAKKFAKKKRASSEREQSVGKRGAARHGFKKKAVKKKSKPKGRQRGKRG